MEMTINFFLFLILLALICEFIDSSLGMGYGTILSPVLIIFGFSPLISVPAILLSQATGGFAASVFHHRFKNASFKRDSRDLKIVFVIIGFGVVATIIGAVAAVNIPQTVLRTYIGLLVTAMGALILINFKFLFSWNRIIIVALISAFNKGISGGGFGPVVTGGQVLAGERHKSAIGITTLAEAPICIISFITYFFAKVVTGAKTSVFNMSPEYILGKLFSSDMFNWPLTLALVIGTILVAPFGPFTTKKINERFIHVILGTLIMLLGILTLVKAPVKI